ncbi:MAG: excinuclease ABC subunit UvrC, partial [Anaerobiospirillum sp.]|nr:excinuclease ABC subunit UvrC [Anaerobiospirillum sp.]
MSALPPSSKSAATSRSAVSALPSSSNALKERLYSEDELTLEFVPEDDAADCAAQNAATVETDSAQEALPAAEAAAGFDAKAFLKTVPNRPGCYRMYNDRDVVIYVGKAKDLKRRLSSYFLKQGHELKTRLLVAHIAHIEFTVTFSESEALILENELIKKYQPHYNILLRDDKSYPYLYLSTTHEFPGVYFHRGARNKAGEFYGPFPDSSAVKDSLRLLQRIFPIRQCLDNVFAHRSRPCLMAQMGKCLAPCVPQPPEQVANYHEQVELLKLFLQGHNQELFATMVAKMEEHAAKMEFEQAALLRDQMTSLRRVQESNSIVSSLSYPVDVIGFALKEGVSCVHVLFIRNGRIFGTRSFFPGNNYGAEPREILLSFLTQFYLNEAHSNLIPDEVVVDFDLAVEAANELNSELVGASSEIMDSAAASSETTDSAAASSEAPDSALSTEGHESSPANTKESADQQAATIVTSVKDGGDSTLGQDAPENDWSEQGAPSEPRQEVTLLQETLQRQFGKTVRFSKGMRGAKHKFLRLAVTNAQVALDSRLSSVSTAKQRIEALEKLLGLSGVMRMECYDISHNMGELTVASCVVFNREGPDNTRYRRYNIDGITPGDDFAAMHQVLTRRFKDPDAGEMPDVIFIDGGPGQLKQAEEVLTAAFAQSKRALPCIVAVAKGEGRKEGLETLILGFSHERINLGLGSPALQ